MAPPKEDCGPQLIARAAGDKIILEGELCEATASELDGLLDASDWQGRGAVCLDLSGLDIDDGAGVAAAINFLRRLRARSSRLVLTGAPQMLCHNLYRVGLLEGDGRIELIDMRQDEPAGF
ncbi:MAG TPA: STAS domain-containing protein [Blastocatellia bacterium]|nr:STAS domain-containing protein [Blastocatellia bacterium]